MDTEKTRQRQAEVLGMVESFKRGERNDMIRIGRRLAEYLHENKLSRVAFLDRGARPAYQCLLEAWHRLYPEEQSPSLHFLNPLGLNSEEMMLDLIPPRALPRGIVLSSRQVTGENPTSLEDAQSHINTLMTGRPREVILEEFESAYEPLVKDKTSPLVVFEICQHTGISTDPVLTTLRQLGFTDVRLALASHVNDLTKTEPAFVALQGEANGRCWPFHRESLVQKSPDTVLSVAVTSAEDRHQGILLREAIKKIYADLWDTVR